MSDARDARAQADAARAGAAPASSVTHCPVCGRTYTGEVRAFCSYHLTYLVAGPPPAERGTTPPPQSASQRRHRLPGVWLIAPAILGVLTGYAVYQYRPAWSGPWFGAQTGQGGEYPLQATSASVAGGDLKGQEVTLPVPDYPQEAFRQKLTGSVTVQVVAGRDGRVSDARSLSGPTALRSTAEEAARGARFAPGRSARRVGVIRYGFVLCRDSGECVE